MLWAIRQLLVPLNYLRIRHGTGLLHSKRVYDFVFPIFFALVTCAAFLWLQLQLAVFSHEELVKRLLDLLALMIVFYMAALAAVATFERQGIDNPLRGEDAILSVRHHDGGTYADKKLSYRQFISYLFGFLSFLSLRLYIVIIILAVGWPQLELHFKAHHRISWLLENIADPVLFLFVMFFVGQLIFTSLLGIYFLTDRIQTLNDPEH